MDDSLKDWQYLPESNMIGAPTRWSDSSGSYRDFRYPRVIAQLPDDWDQAKHGPIIAEAPAMLAALRALIPLALEAICNREESDDDEDRASLPAWRADLDEAQAILARIDGEAAQ